MNHNGCRALAFVQLDIATMIRTRFLKVCECMKVAMRVAIGENGLVERGEIARVVKMQTMRAFVRSRENPLKGFMCPSGWHVLVKYYDKTEIRVSPFPRLQGLERGLLTAPTHHHEAFQCVLSSLHTFWENFPEGHPSQNYSGLSTLNHEVLMEARTRNGSWQASSGRGTWTNQTYTGMRVIWRLYRYGTTQLKDNLKELIWLLISPKCIYFSPGVILGWVTFRRFGTIKFKETTEACVNDMSHCFEYHGVFLGGDDLGYELNIVMYCKLLTLSLCGSGSTHNDHTCTRVDGVADKAGMK
ncbi:hypothetical protein V8G54_005680 [Vigna mungo]|uniref:Uncharacterized protein n=1 Tax=Vigna mungo TaxID=3915 RepID=A0AAQ3NZ22_VIGMU